MTMAQLSWTISEIASITNGQSNDNGAVTYVTGISIDSRATLQGDLFIALPGTKSNGHTFLSAAQEAGASGALVTQIDSAVDIPQICVADCFEALRQLALAGRQRFQGIKFGITGSVGKTGSKDMLWHVLSQFGTCHASQRSFNNHIGVPVTLASLPEYADFSVQEMGMSASGEIANLTHMVRPNVAFITRVANTHREFFPSTAAIADAKAEIFQGLEQASIAILNRDDAFFENLQTAAINNGAKRIISFGNHPDSDYRLLSIDHHVNGMTISARLAGLICIFELRMYGRHLAENAMGVLACVGAAGLPADQAAAQLIDCLPSTGRGQRSKGIYRECKISIIDDSYNASPASMAAAFASLIDTPPQVMILSEMRELGEAKAAAHEALVPQINKLAPRVVIAIGSAMHEILGGLDQTTSSFAAADINTAVSYLDQSICNGDRIFIKGSNSSGAWRVRDALFASIKKDVQKTNAKGASHVA